MIIENKAFSIYHERENKMGTIVCQSCNSVIDHFEDEKVSILYSNCCECCDQDIMNEE